MKKSPLLLLISIIVFAILAWGHIQLSQASPAVGASLAAPCVSGTAATYPCNNIHLLAYLSNSEMGTAESILGGNVWGWTDPETGREYVLLTFQDGTVFIDISEPEAPIYLGKLPSHDYPVATIYRDIKVYADHAFIVGDQATSPSQQGLQVFDLTTLRGITSPITFTATAHDDSFNDGHNMFIHQETGYAYIVRNMDTCPGAMVFNVQQPITPTYAGCYDNDGAASDTACVIYAGPDEAYQGREICVFSSDDRLVVGDLTTKTLTMTSQLSLLNYPQVARAHHAWFTDDHRYIISVDMDDEHHFGLDTRIFFWDMSDLDIPERTPAFIYEGPTTGSDHNVWVRDGLAYVGNLRSGLRILDISNIPDVQEVAFFDTFPANNTPGHQQGAWSAYVYFESGVVAVNNREGGLFLLRPLLAKSFLPFIVE